MENDKNTNGTLLLHNPLDLAGESGEKAVDRRKKGVEARADLDHQLREGEKEINVIILFLDHFCKSRDKL